MSLHTVYGFAILRVIPLLFLLICGSVSAGAQVLYGTVVGSVTDAAGGAVPSASIKIQNTGTGQVREAVTDESGTFSFSSVTGGTYDVTVSKEGFQSFRTTGLNVGADATVRVDAQMRVGDVQQTVDVTASTVTLQTDSAEVRTAISRRTLENLPIPIGRNYQNLLVTVPGVSPPTNQHSVAANPARGLSFNVNGTARNSNAVRIDGALANNIWLPHVTSYVPALDSIQEVSMVTATADANQGLSGGSAVNVQIKSGTNELHGSLFEFHSNNVIKSKPFFLPAGQGKPKYIDNQFGGSLGGPVIRNKLFYFGSWEGTFNRQTGSSFVTVPTAAMRAGDFSGSAAPIFDPLTGNPDGSGRTQLAGNRVPPNRIDPIAAKIIAVTPLPTYPDLLSNNYYATGAYAVNRSKLDAKMNWVANSKLNVSGRMGWLNYGMDNPPVFGDAGGPGVASAGGRAGHAFGNVYSTTLSATYVATPALVVDSYFGWTQTKSNHDPVGLDKKIGLDTLGILGTNSNGALSGGWPAFVVTSFTDMGTPTGSSALRYDDTNYEYTANASWVKSTHNVSFGVDIQRFAINHYEAPSAPGVFTFNGGVTTVRGGASPNQFNNYASFLLGMPYTATQELLPFDDNRLTSRQISYSFYVQDTWQATRNLTLSYGLRWDYFPMGKRMSRGMERYDFNTNTMLICGVGNNPTGCGYNIEQKNFSPRLGIAYRPSSTFVIRMGYGINYDPYPLAFVRNMLTNYPNDLLQTVTPANAFLSASPLRSGLPAVVVPDISSGRVAVPATYDVRSLPDYVERGYIQSWNFSLQKELWGGFVAQAAYVGTRQVKISQRFNLNAGQVLGAGTAGQPFFAKFGRTSATEILTPVGHNKYDSLQTSLQRRFAQGLSINMSYTWSKAMGICCDDLSDSPPSIQIPQYFHLNRAIMPYDRTHNFTSSFTYELPFGRGKRYLTSGFASKLAGGWQVNGLLAAYSGSPFSVSASGTSLNAPGNTQRANQVKPEVAILGGIGPGQSYFDPLAFAQVTTPTFGTAGFDSVRGPGTINFDAGLFRSFKPSERMNIQFRAEAMNVTNTPHFANPNANVSNLVLRPDGTYNLGGFSVITATQGFGREGIDERLFRLGLRITF
jgi:hypothetical protein